MKIYTKICGLTRAQDAIAAAQLDVDAIGLVFFAGSKRAVSVAQAQEIVRVLPPFVSVVALFVNESAEQIRKILAQVPIDILQFHGDESPEFCRQFHRPYLKAVRVQSVADIEAACTQLPMHERCCLMRLWKARMVGRGIRLIGICCPKI